VLVLDRDRPVARIVPLASESEDVLRDLLDERERGW